MCPGADARTVAAMRLSLPSLTAAVGVTAAVLAAAAPARGADAIFGGTARGGAPIVVKADARLQTLKSIVVSWDAPCSDDRYYGSGGELTPPKRSRASRRARASCSSSATPR